MEWAYEGPGLSTLPALCLLLLSLRESMITTPRLTEGLSNATAPSPSRSVSKQDPLTLQHPSITHPMAGSSDFHPSSFVTRTIVPASCPVILPYSLQFSLHAGTEKTKMLTAYSPQDTPPILKPGVWGFPWPPHQRFSRHLPSPQRHFANQSVQSSEHCFGRGEEIYLIILKFSVFVSVVIKRKNTYMSIKHPPSVPSFRF